MTQKDKDLVCKDICSRIPYNVIVHLNLGKGQIWKIDLRIENSKDVEEILYLLKKQPEKIKPYLRPMSSMTEEELDELNVVFDNSDTEYRVEAQDWLNAHHFDYRGLIEKGLAIEVNESNNPYED